MGPDTTRGWLVANSKPLLCSQAVTAKSFRKALLTYLLHGLSPKVNYTGRATAAIGEVSALDSKKGDRLSSGLSSEHRNEVGQ
jgi:hypothetical protein